MQFWAKAWAQPWPATASYGFIMFLHVLSMILSVFKAVFFQYTIHYFLVIYERIGCILAYI